jgi:hypothetical protein
MVSAFWLSRSPKRTLSYDHDTRQLRHLGIGSRRQPSAAADGERGRRRFPSLVAVVDTLEEFVAGASRLIDEAEATLNLQVQQAKCQHNSHYA